MSIPALESMPGFEPVLVTGEDIDDLASFTGMSPDRCRDRLRTYSTEEMAQEWRDAEPRSPEAILDFYQSTELYIWALMQWHASVARKPYWDALHRLCELVPNDGPKKVFDFGCGIGTDSLFLASRGYDVMLVDVAGPTLEFARHRFQRRGLKARFVESSSPLPNPPETFDAVVCFDVFEHLPEPLGAAKQLVGALKPGGVLLQQGGFLDEGGHPCHLDEGLRRFGGLRWSIYLAGLGLINDQGYAYLKAGGWQRGAQLARYALWRATGLWSIYVPHSDEEL